MHPQFEYDQEGSGFILAFQEAGHLYEGAQVWAYVIRGYFWPGQYNSGTIQQFHADRAHSPMKFLHK